MIVIRPGEEPCARSTEIALTAGAGIRALLDLMERMDQARMPALMMVLQCLLLEAGMVDVAAMERMANAVAKNVAAAPIHQLSA